MTEFLILISWLFPGVQLVNVVLNLLFPQKIGKSSQLNDELISVLIPARNEEKNLPALLNSLSTMKNQLIEILVYDDLSTDNTADLVQRYAQSDSRCRLIRGQFLPEGWLGKNHACFELAREAKGQYLLFLDADVEVKGNILADALFWFKRHSLDLLSVFPFQLMKTPGERVTVPLMNYILLTLLPLILVRTSPFVSHSAANGQFMLFNAQTYHRLEPHRRFRNSAVEDIAIARNYKKEKCRVACLTGETRISCRMYHSGREALDGFSKNIFMFFGNSPLLAFSFWFLASAGFVPVLIVQPAMLPLYLILVTMVQIFCSLAGKQNAAGHVLFFPVHLLTMLIIMIKGLLIKKRKLYLWKDRNIFH